MIPTHTSPRLPLASKVAASLAGAVLLATVGLSGAWRPHPAPPFVRATVALGGAIGADAVVVDGPLGRVAVGDGLDGVVHLLDDRDGRLLRTIAVGAAFAPQALAVDARRHRLYVAGQAADGSGVLLWTLDARSGVPLHVVRVGGGVARVGVDERAGRVIVVDDDGHATTRDTLMGRVQRAGRVGPTPLTVAVDARRARAFVLDGGAYVEGNPSGEGAVSVLDERTGRVLRTIPVGAAPSAIAEDAPAGLVVVANRGAGTVSVLDARDGAQRGVIQVGGQPAAVAVNERWGRAFVLDAQNDIVSVIDLHRGVMLRRVRVGMHPHALAIDSMRGLVLIATDGPLDDQGRSLGPGVVDLLDAASGAAVRAVPVGVAPRAVAIDAWHGLAIVVNSGGAMGAPAEGATAWVSRLRRWLPWVPALVPVPSAGRAPASVTILDLRAAR